MIIVRLIDVLTPEEKQKLEDMYLKLEEEAELFYKKYDIDREALPPST